MKILLTSFLCISITILPSCSENNVSPDRQTIYYSISAEPVTLDPQIADDSSAKLIIMNLFEGLTRLDENHQPVCGVAESWQTNPQHTEYTFHLRENACWNDGTPLTAQDFVYGFCRTFLPSTGSSTAQSLFCIKNAQKIRNGQAAVSSLGVSADDSYTLTIQLEYFEPRFLELLASPPAMPCRQDFFESTGGQYGLESDKILSNGTFCISENGWEHGQYIHLDKNGYYHGSSSPVPQNVSIAISEPPENVCNAILGGNIDCYALDTSQLAQAQKQHFHLTAFSDTVWGIAFNTQDEIFRNADIRTVLLSAINRNIIAENLPESCSPAENIIPDTTRLNGMNYRTLVGGNMGIRFSDNAKTTFAEILSRYEEEEEPEFPVLNILCTDDDSTRSVVNSVIQAWNRLTGRFVNKTPVPRSELENKIASGDYRIVIAPLMLDGDSPADTLKLFTSDNVSNPARLSDKQYDEMIAKILRSPETDVTDEMVQAEKYLNTNGIFYPLYIEDRYYASAPNVTGIIFHPYGAEADFSLAHKTEK